EPRIAQREFARIVSARRFVKGKAAREGIPALILVREVGNPEIALPSRAGRSAGPDQRTRHRAIESDVGEIEILPQQCGSCAILFDAGGRKRDMEARLTLREHSRGIDAG